MSISSHTPFASFREWTDQRFWTEGRGVLRWLYLDSKRPLLDRNTQDNTQRKTSVGWRGTRYGWCIENNTSGSWPLIRRTPPSPTGKFCRDRFVRRWRGRIGCPSMVHGNGVVWVFTSTEEGVERECENTVCRRGVGIRKSVEGHGQFEVLCTCVD